MPAGIAAVFGKAGLIRRSPSPGLLPGPERACQPKRPGQDGTGSKGIDQEPGGNDLFQDVAAASKSAGPPGRAPTSGTRHPGGKAAITASSITADKYSLA